VDPEAFLSGEDHGEPAFGVTHDLRYWDVGLGRVSGSPWHNSTVADGRVAVIGAGNVGCALAADLTLRGAQVRLYNRSAERLEQIRKAGGVTVTGAVEGFAPIAHLTTDMGEAVRDADVVAVTLPTPPHHVAALIEATTKDQLLWLDPGHSGGALYLAAQARQRKAGARPLICQLSTASHGSRMTGPATVGVFALTAASLAAFPSSDLEECHARVDALLPGQFGTTPSVLELDLQNVNAVMHPAQMVCNASWIEATGGDFFIYREGTGPATAGVIEAVDSERVALADRLGVPTLSLIDACARAGYTTTNGAASGRVYEALQAGDPISRVKAPGILDHRYLHEDVGWGLVQWMHLAETAKVAVPTMAAVTTLAGVLNSVDYLTTGLTLERMGLAGIGADDIAQYAYSGIA
jgi:opine dehydrogenase